MTENLIVHHYTTQPGLTGILNEKEIWATNIEYLNDMREFKHTVDLIDEIIRKEIKIGTIAGTFLDYFQSAITLASPGASIFVTSFSEEADLLSQWRGYCGKGGSGFSIGIDKTNLERIAASFGATVEQCLYNIDDQVKELQRHFEWIRCNRQDASSAMTSILEMLVSVAPRFKDAAFAEEKEWRVILRLHNLKEEDKISRITFRHGTMTLVPYVKIPLAWNGYIPVTKLVVGPSLDSKLAKNAVDAFLLKCGLPIRAENSRVPFRDW